MHRKRSQKRQRIQLTFVYTLMVIAVVSILAILILVIQGYRYNRFDGKLEQGGLVQFNSRPSGATVSVDNITLANKTASKVTLTAGKHTVAMSREGYSTWKKDVMVRPGTILWLNYALLFPISPTVETAAQYTTVSSTLASPNQKRMAAITDTAEVFVTPLDDDKPETAKIAIPTDAYTKPADGIAQTFELQSWDKNSNNILIRHSYADKAEYIALDVRDGGARNISTELGLDIAKVQFSRSDSNVLYVVTKANELRRINISASTVSGPLASNVADMSINEDRIIMYTTLADSNGKRSIGYISSGSNIAKVIRTYAADSGELRAVTGNYYGDHYLTVLEGTSLRVSKGDFPASDSSAAPELARVASLTVAGGADYIGFSPTGNRMIYAAKGTQVVTYDLELKSHAVTTLQDTLTRGVEWLDDYHLFAVGANGYYYDFDGSNSQLFASNTLDESAALSNNGKYIYYFANTEKGASLQRVKLTID